MLFFSLRYMVRHPCEHLLRGFNYISMGILSQVTPLKDLECIGRKRGRRHLLKVLLFKIDTCS